MIPVETAGTLFPGLIDLHNHLSYNVLPPWAPVPKRFTHRGQWPDHPDYRRLISGPMTVLGEYRGADGQPTLVSALVRYVECKCLMGGVTTSQGIRLASNAGIQRFYRGIVRNVEQTDDNDLSEAQARIPDIAAKDARAFLARLQKEDSCFLLHVSEGVTLRMPSDSPARRHFLALEVAPDQWAINDRLTAIHAAGLLPEDFEVLAAHKGSMVWSPLSNLLLYGQTACVEAARAAGVPIGLGADWSPSGSKNLLGELKVAWLYSQHVLNGLFSARALVAMATRQAAHILKWQHALGTPRGGQAGRHPGHRGHHGRPLRRLDPSQGDLDPVSHDQRRRPLWRSRPDGQAGAARRDGPCRGPDAPAVPEAGDGRPGRGGGLPANRDGTLRTALRDLKKLARELERPRALDRRTSRALDAPAQPVWTLALDEIRDTGVELRPRLPFNGPQDFTGPERHPRLTSRVPLSEVVKPMKLDPLTVADDEDFLAQIAAQPNVPQPIRQEFQRSSTERTLAIPAVQAAAWRFR